MPEWWNLDQGLIWMRTGNAQQVALGEGDPEGVAERALTYLDVILSGFDVADQTQHTKDMPEPQPGEYKAGAADTLMQHLRSGAVKAIWADRDEVTYIPNHTFKKYVWETYGPNDIITLCRPRTRLEKARGLPVATLPILIEASTLQAVYTPTAPEEMQSSLRQELFASKPAPSNRRASKKDIAAEYISRTFPNGLPALEDGHGALSSAIKSLAKTILKERGVPISEDTIRIAAGLKKGGKQE